MQQIISHLSPEYIALGIGHNNGAYYYSKELLENIIPHIKTERPWILINAENQCMDNAIVIIHNNAHPERYEWLEGYKNLILVCSQIKTLLRMIQDHPKCHSVYLPLSIDTDYVKQFKAKRKTREVAYFGRMAKCPQKIMVDPSIDKIYGEDREALLTTVSRYKKVYAIGRCALEAQCLGCKVLPHKGEWENVKWELKDNKDVISMLQKIINEIDGKE